MTGYNISAYLRKLLADQQGKGSENPYTQLYYPPSPSRDPIQAELKEIKAYTEDSEGKNSDSLAERIFGQQLEQKKLSRNHLESLIEERQKLHDQQMDSLQQEISQIKNRLSFLKRPYSIHPPQQAIQLEKMLLQTESEQRREDVMFWKDLAEVRQQLLDTSFEYKQTQERAKLLKPWEDHYE